MTYHAAAPPPSHHTIPPCRHATMPPYHLPHHANLLTTPSLPLPHLTLPYQTSAKNSQNVEKAFTTMASQVRHATNLTT